MVNLNSYLEQTRKGLEHVKGHADWHQERLHEVLNYIEAGTGSFTGCVGSLRSMHIAMASYAWFAEHDLAAMKQHAYVAAKLERIEYQAWRWSDYQGPIAAWWYGRLMPLISDHEPLLRWYAQFESLLPKKVTKVPTLEYCGEQMRLAMCGDWPTLGERSERWLANPPSRTKEFVADMRFFLALAQGDKASMEAQLAEITSPKSLKKRNDYSTGFTHWFISDEAVSYAKVAWRHGYQVEVDTPYIPKDWLPVESLPVYTDPYPFMAAFDIDQPLPDQPYPG